MFGGNASAEGGGDDEGADDAAVSGRFSMFSLLAHTLRCKYLEFQAITLTSIL